MEPLSVMDLISQTGYVVKFVLIMLLVASVWSWAVIFSKWMSFKQAKADSEKFLDLFWNASSLDKIFGESKEYSASPVSNVFRAGYVEFQKVSAKGKESNKTSLEIAQTGIDNVQRALRKAAIQEVQRLEKKLPVLASVASAAPFIGLFGTVWGIMDSFQGLAQGGPATLQRVAPGISEALIATAVGLAAAIPAVIFYNSYVNKVRAFRTEMDSFASDFTNIIERNYLS